MFFVPFPRSLVVIHDLMDCVLVQRAPFLFQVLNIVAWASSFIHVELLLQSFVALLGEGVPYVLARPSFVTAYDGPAVSLLFILLF